MEYEDDSDILLGHLEQFERTLKIQEELGINGECPTSSAEICLNGRRRNYGNQI